MQQELQRHAYKMILCNSNNTSEEEIELAKKIEEGSQYAKKKLARS